MTYNVSSGTLSLYSLHYYYYHSRLSRDTKFSKAFTTSNDATNKNE